MPKHVDPKPQSKLDEAYEKVVAAANLDLKWIGISSTMLKVRLVVTMAVILSGLYFDGLAMRTIIPLTTLILMAVSEAYLSFKRVALWKDKAQAEESYFAALRESSKENAARTMDLLANVLLTESFDQGSVGSKEYDRTLN